MFRLSSKIILAFSIIIITGSTLMVSIISYSTRAGYETFVSDNDMRFVNSMSTVLEEFYREHQSWDNVRTFIQIPKPSRMTQTMDMNKRRVTGYPHMLLTDPNGEIILNTGVKTTGTIESNERACAIKYNDEIVAYLYAGSMLDGGLTQEEEFFLNKIKTIIIMVSLFILIISIIVTYILSRKITKPLTDLSQAAKEIEQGNYPHIVEEKGKDELTRLIRSFNQMTGAIESNDKWRKQVIADSAHELRTPVTLIQGNLELILEGVYKADNANIENIYNETMVLSRLINELQELSSAESGKIGLCNETLNLQTVIENTVELYRPEAIKNNITITNNIKGGLPDIAGDSQKLKQVFSNILNNGIRYTPSGGDIKIDAKIEQDRVTLIFADSGTGIPEDELEKVFDRFYRTDGARNRATGGSGLGLAICREIIRLHNGSIHAEKNSPKGIKIVVTL